MPQRLSSIRSYKGIFVFFILVTLALIAFVFYTSFSQAIITIYTKKDKIPLDFNVKIAKDQDLNSEPKILAGRVLQTTETDEAIITDIPKKEVGDRAKGKVIIYNNMEEPQGIVAKTQLESEKTGLIFRTETAVNLPAKGKVEAAVTADKPGADGEIEPDKFRLIKLSETWQKLIYGESKEKFKIQKKEAKVATQKIIDKEKQKLVDDLTERAIAKLKNKLTGNETLIEKTIKKDIIESNASIAPDTEADKFSMYVKVKITALAFDEKSLLDIAEAKLKSKLTREQEHLKTNLEALKYEIESYDLDKNEAKLKIHIESEAGSKISPDEINKEKLLGLSQSEVEMYFNNEPRIDRIEILFSPFWVKKVPTLKDHIEIVIKK